MLFSPKSFQFARWLVVMLCGLWFLIVVFFRLFGVGAEQSERKTGATKRLGFFVMTLAMKNLYQAMLFFLLPFYWRSATLGAINQWFVVGIALCALLATLDLFFDNLLMRHRAVSSLYFLVTLFAAMNLALPAVLPGLSTRWAILGAAVFSTMGYATMHVPWPKLRTHQGLVGLGGGLAIALAAAFFGGPLIPPVPHYVIERGVGPATIDDGRLTMQLTRAHRSAIEELVAVTHVLAPEGSADDFEHVWKLDGEEVIRAAPSVRYMSQQPDVAILSSRVSADDLPDDAVGRWFIEVVTGDGRLVGRVRFTVFD